MGILSRTTSQTIPSNPFIIDPIESRILVRLIWKFCHQQFLIAPTSKSQSSDKIVISSNDWSCNPQVIDRDPKSQNSRPIDLQIPLKSTRFEVWPDTSSWTLIRILVQPQPQTSLFVLLPIFAGPFIWQCVGLYFVQNYLYFLYL